MLTVTLTLQVWFHAFLSAQVLATQAPAQEQVAESEDSYAKQITQEIVDAEKK